MKATIQTPLLGLISTFLRALAFTAIICPQAFSGIQVVEHHLENGMTVLLYPNKQTPTIACRLFYTTGSVHEGPGTTGIAHMLEHMLFKGTKKVGIKDSVSDAIYIHTIDSIVSLKRAAVASGDTISASRLHTAYDSTLAEHRKLFIKDELWETYLKEGGSNLNAFTSDLATAYYVTLPKNKLELFLWMEADRMQNAVLREFYPERDVVMEERRMRKEDTPLGRYWESLYGVFYEAHPYRLPTIGYISDIAHYTREMAQEHYRKYYKPNNAILILAGDLEPLESLTMIKRYFGPIKSGKSFAEVVTREPVPAGEKRLTVYKNDAKPRYDLMFHTPGFPHNHIYALDIVEGVLSGNSGRLHRQLVKESKLAVAAGAGSQADKYHSAFHIYVQLGPDPKPQKVEKAVWRILKELSQKPISDRELQRVKNQVKARSLRELQDIEHLATQLGFYQLWGDWRYINSFPQFVDSVTAEQVQSVCASYFLKKSSTVGIVLPEGDND